MLRKHVLTTMLIALSFLPFAYSGLTQASSEPAHALAIDHAAETDLAQITPEEMALEASFRALPDPITWSQDPATGARFRRATAHEVDANVWPSSTFLVEAGSLASLRNGPTEAYFPIPQSDVSFAALRVQLVSQRREETFYTTGAGPPGSLMPTDTATTPVFFDYALGEAATPDVEARLTADDEGGFFGEARYHGLRATLEPSEAWWTVDPIGAPNDPPSELSIVMLSAAMYPVAFPNPEGPLPDAGSTDVLHYYNYNNMGEIKWCTRYLSSWKAKIDTIKAETNAGFNTNVGGTDARLSRVHDHCWTASTLTIAQGCANNGGCVDSNGHNYPYNSDAAIATEYRLDVWADVAHSHLHYTFATASIAQAIHDGTQSDPGGSLCGLAKFPDSTAPVAANGGSVAAGLPLPSGCKNFVSTHEIGHNFNAVHDNEWYGTCGGGGTAISVMGQSGFAGASCRFNDFRWPARNAIAACVTLSSCPRTGTA